MSMLTGPSSVIGLLAEMYMLYIFAVLSRKLGAVTHMPPYYRGFYWAMGLIGVAVVAHAMRLAASAAPDWPPTLNSDVFFLLTYDLPLGLSVITGVAVAWRYWNWLFREQR